jgi:hypothetical protein
MLPVAMPNGTLRELRLTLRALEVAVEIEEHRLTMLGLKPDRQTIYHEGPLNGPLRCDLLNFAQQLQRDLVTEPSRPGVPDDDDKKTKGRSSPKAKARASYAHRYRRPARSDAAQ